MLTREILERIQKILAEDEKFANEFRKVSSLEEMVELLNNKRLAITKEEAQELIALSRRACAEISEQMSDNVAGGVGYDVFIAIKKEGEDLYNRYFESQ